MNQKRIVVLFGIIILSICLYFGISEIAHNRGHVEGLENTIEELTEVKRQLEEEYADFVMSSSDDRMEQREAIERLKVQNSIDKADVNQLKKEQIRLMEEIEAITGPDVLGIEKLRMKGISDYTIIEDELYLLSEDMIGFEGVLGGTMMFNDVRVLNDRWAYGVFEDGHISGRGLYEFTISDDKTVTWKIIEEHLDE